jgi:hypothetical protein
MTCRSPLRNSANQNALWGGASPAKYCSTRFSSASRSRPATSSGWGPYACNTRRSGSLSSRRSAGPPDPLRRPRMCQCTPLSSIHQPSSIGCGHAWTPCSWARLLELAVRTRSANDSGFWRWRPMAPSCQGGRPYPDLPPTVRIGSALLLADGNPGIAPIATRACCMLGMRPLTGAEHSRRSAATPLPPSGNASACSTHSSRPPRATPDPATACPPGLPCDSIQGTVSCPPGFRPRCWSTVV